MPDILHRVGIDASLNKLFAALTTIDGLCGGGSAPHWQHRRRWHHQFGFCDMRVICADPNKLVHWRCHARPR